MIHPTAIIDSSAEIDLDVEIGPYTVVEARARIAAGTCIGSNAYIGPDTLIGPNNRIHHAATVGSDSQALAFKPGVRSYLQIGEGNIIREHTTLNRSSQPRGATRVGDFNCFMANAHVAHDCVVGNHTIFANSAAIGGLCEVEDYAILGGLVGVHQYCRVGRHAIVGSNSKINMDVAPFLTVDGHPARPHGLNTIGLKRNGFPPETIRRIGAAYQILFYQRRKLESALELLRADYADSPEVRCIVRFITHSRRGILRPRRGGRY